VHIIVVVAIETLNSYSNTYLCGVCMSKDLTTIQISKKLRDKLKELGKKGETYEDIIGRLVELAERE